MVAVVQRMAEGPTDRTELIPGRATQGKLHGLVAWVPMGPMQPMMTMAPWDGPMCGPGPDGPGPDYTYLL